MPEFCVRCGIRPTTVDWFHCEPCWQDECNEAHKALAELNASTALSPDDDAAHP